MKFPWSELKILPVHRSVQKNICRLYNTDGILVKFTLILNSNLCLEWEIYGY